jgi:ATP-binding cassette, subfamily B, multidrug efflux pump
LKEFSLLKRYFTRYRWYFAIGFVSLFLVDGCQIVIPWLVKQVIDLLAAGISAPEKIIWNGILILVLALFIGGTRFIWRYCIIGVSRKIEEDLRNRFYRHLQSLSFSYFDRTTIGDLMAHAVNDLEAVRMMCGMALVASADAGLLMIASLIMMISISPLLTLYVLIPLPIVTTTVLLLGPKLHSRFRGVQEGFSHLSQKAQETFSGIRVVKSFVQEGAERENFEKLNKDYIRQNLKLVKVWGLLHPVIWSVAGSCLAIILWFGGGLVIRGEMSMGEFVAFNSYLGILVWPMIAIGWVVNLYQRGKASLIRLYQIFEIQPEIQDVEGAIDKPIHGEIEFRDLTFGYDDAEPVLKNINLRIEPGQWIAVMGRTGSAKTTLAHLISRLYDPPENTLFIDGIEIHKWKLQSLRSQIGFVPQQTFLFSDTISNNIRFGENLPQNEIEVLAEAAKIYKDILLFPNKFETLVGEKGVTLSGGQKQRVAIARSIAINSPVLIFDDALSAVDAETEEALVDELTSRIKDRTVILVSHRISTASRAHRIVYLEDGRIVEDGTHEDLVKLRGRYFEIYEHQKLMEELDLAGTESDSAGMAGGS